MSVSRLVRLWFGLTEPVSRAAYILTGLGLMAFKYAVEAAVVHDVTDRWLTPSDYFNPLLASRQAAIGGHDWLLMAMVAWTLPFLWIGVSMTMRRAEDAGLSPFLALLYFVPVVNYLLMLALCLPPSRPRAAAGVVSRAGGGHVLRAALLGMAVGVGIAVSMVGATVLIFGEYGTVLFVATPFVMGAAAAYIFNLEARRPTGLTLLVAMLAVAAAGSAVLLFALEGLLCLAMAAPPAVVMVLMGAALGRAIALRPRAGPPGLAAVLLPLPLLAGIESDRPAPPPAEVRTTVEIAAPADVVWRHVVTFSELDEPPPWIFRLGIAYPRRATIEGRGVGALRRCEFSTGAFLEPITAWDEPSRLAFDVAAQPPPLTEWSPYRHVAAVHLDRYLRVRGGEFRLVPLPGGRTRLEGRTAYDLRLHPAEYWSLWSDALIHAIHRRVLGHIKALSEATAPAGD
jgi:uncharacterized membrane protein YhaH (DUF805 family)